MTKTVEQLKREAAEATEALRLAEIAERDRKQEEERAVRIRQAKEEERVENTKRIAVAKQLVKALRSSGFKNAECSEEGRIYVRGRSPQNKDCFLSDGDAALSIERHTTSHFSGSDVHRGQLKVVVGDWGCKKSYFPKDDGYYNIEKIVKLVKERIEVIVANERVRREKYVAEQSNKQLAETLQAEFKVSGIEISKGRYDTRGRWTSYDAPKGHVYISIGAVSEEQARQILPALIKAGVISTK